MRFLLVVMFLVFGITAISAQKIYSTKTGKITFESKAPLEDIEARNSEVEGKLNTNGLVTFTLLMKGFQFENQLMEDHFNENYVQSSVYPKADFKGNITNIKSINFSKDGVYPAKAKGKLTIKGITKEIETTGTLTVKNQKVLASSTFDIKLKDFNIGGSNIGKKIAENININVNCQYD